jgi:hypothetical protein
MGQAEKMALPRQSHRVAIGLLFAATAALIAWRARFALGDNGGDHLLWWKASRAVMAGYDPYGIGPTGQLPAVNDRFFYPLPALSLSLPFDWLSPRWAAFWFTIASAGLLGFAITRDGYARVPVLFSTAFLTAAQFAQSSPLITALALVPSLAFLSLLKPNLGLCLFAAWPRWRPVVGVVILGLLSLAMMPGWPWEWIATVRSSPVHHAPWRTGIGAVGLLGLLRWRRPEGRLLTAMTVVAHGTSFYDEIPLWLVAETRREAMVLTLMSWLGWLAWHSIGDGQLASSTAWASAFHYLPALVMVLRRPNEGDVPQWLERVLTKSPRWVRGTQRMM